jgi:hypothetical protein
MAKNKANADGTVTVDFTNVKERGDIQTKRQPPGDYVGVVEKVDPKYVSKAGKPQWLYIIKVNSGHYPYYCDPFDVDQAWKIRNLFVAAGFNVPKKKTSVNPNSPVGKQVGVTLEDDEYEGKMKSTIAALMPVSEVTDTNVPDAGETDEETTVASTNGKAGKKDKKNKKGKKATVSDDELEEIEVAEL